jgi:hypothetical protein
MRGAWRVHVQGQRQVDDAGFQDVQEAARARAQQFTLVPFTIEVTSVVLEEHYNVVSKEGWAVKLDLLVTNRDRQSLAVSPDIGIDVADAQCQVGAIIHENWDDPAWERLPQSTLRRAGASARMKVYVGCKHADKLGGAFDISFGSTKILLRRQ